jgi:hypothetical protein
MQRHIHNSSKSDAQCEIAEKIEAKDLTERLKWLSDQILQDAPRLCLEFVQTADFGHFITQEVIDRAKNFSEERFDNLARDLVEKVRNVVDSQRATEPTFTFPRPIQTPRME